MTRGENTGTPVNLSCYLPLHVYRQARQGHDRPEVIGRGGQFFDTMNVAGKAGFVGVVLAVILSCSQAKVETDQKWLSFRCPDGQTVMAQFHLPEDQFVNVRFAGRELRLPHVISGSGARYGDGKTTFWNKGKSVLMQVDDKVIVQDCMLQ